MAAETRCEDDAEAGDCSIEVGIQPGEEAEGCAKGMFRMEGFHLISN